jgi:MFS family permease
LPTHLRESPVLHFSAAEIGLVGSAYLTGAVTGAVLFGYLTDRFGRKKLFFVTLGLHLAATRELEARSAHPGTKKRPPPTNEVAL